MYISAIKKGMRYLAASIVIAAAGAVYGLFGHGVYSYYMTYAFMIPLLAGAVPHLLAAMRGEREEGETAADGAAEAEAACSALNSADAPEDAGEPARKPRLDLSSAQLAFIVTLTAGSLLKGVLDIYGTTNRLLIAYPVAALLILAFMAAAALKQSGKLPQIKGKETIIEIAE